ncbi:hypothetical protein ACFV1L_21360 [Kitasatospora sp. NPDC059646]|uniref:hypothetical protein n=1 Tax=Kitasatospora sp. NPDC059646 TaxID=3346893 RepID=UPI0036C36752
MSRTARRGLAPDAAGRALSHTVRPPRSRLPWSPAALEAELHTALAAYEERAAAWREAFVDLDDDVLAEAAVEARAFGADPAAAVDELVRSLFGQLADWQQAIGELGRGLTAAIHGRPLPDWTADAGRTEDVRWHHARQALLEAVARHHHGALPAGPGDRPW